MSELGQVTWNENLERYFAETGERAQCLSLIHKRAEEIYSHRRTYIDLPIVIISSVTGFLSVGTSSMFAGQEQLASILLGVASLFVSVLNTTGSYFGWAKRSEGHRISSIQYSKLYRFLAIEMSLPRDERMSPTDLLKYTRESYDRLQEEVSPMIPPTLVGEFNKKFEKYKDVSRPEELNGLKGISVYRDTFTVKNPMMSPRPSEVGLEIKNETT